MVWFHCFAYGCPAFPIPLIEETAFSPIVCSLLLCHKLIAHIYVGLSWALNSVTLICVYFSANVMLFQLL